MSCFTTTAPIGTAPLVSCLAKFMMSGVTPNASAPDRKSTRLNSSHQIISYAVFCLKKKNKNQHTSHHLNFSALVRQFHREPETRLDRQRATRSVARYRGHAAARPNHGAQIDRDQLI